MLKLEKKLIGLQILQNILFIILIISIIFLIILISKINITNTSEDRGTLDKDIYNAMIKKYIGNNKTGSEVKSMIEEVINQNDKYVGESGKFIGIKIAEGTTINNLKSSLGEIGAERLTGICNKSNAYTNGDNTQDNVNAAKKEMMALYKVISSEKIYSISDKDKDESGITNGIIHTVYIKENN